MALEEPSVCTEVEQHGNYEVDEEYDEEEDSWSSESEVGDVLDWLDSKEGTEGDGIGGTSFSVSAARRPNARGGLLSRPLQPLSNRSQKFASHIRANPLEEWEGRMNVGMSNAVATAIRDTVRDSAIGRTKNTEKADRATVEQANFARVDSNPRTEGLTLRMQPIGRVLWALMESCGGLHPLGIEVASAADLTTKISKPTGDNQQLNDDDGRQLIDLLGLSERFAGDDRCLWAS
ncbi:uncharacterized protein LOC110024790 [Phalaenopsis equestris]|uniref:uncharacterized protein LOC110024790 n=1 Tax=Phalaenopsis equestris TaxID=78828 RepID=UPI0009E24657|nr:uncharacterized protein LOC110024790 [Phalaenopsis equestris]